MFGKTKTLFKFSLFIFFLGSNGFYVKGMDQYKYTKLCAVSDEDESTNLFSSSNDSINYKTMNHQTPNFKSPNYLFVLQNNDKLNDIFSDSKNTQDRESIIKELKEFLLCSLQNNPKFIFDIWIKKMTNSELHEYLVQTAMKWIIEIYEHVDLKKIEDFFKNQPEGILKTTIRFMHLRKTKKLIDSYNIEILNHALIAANQSGILNFGCSFIIENSLKFSSKLYSLFPYICEIIPHICQKPITELNLFGNALPKLSEEICYLKNLKKINLAYNNLSKIPTVLLKLKNLKEIIVDQKLEQDNNNKKFYSTFSDFKINFYIR